jgi:hypothetical protein
MQLIVKFSGLFLYTAPNERQLYVLAPKTPTKHLHTVKLKVIEGQIQGQQENEKTLDGKHLTLEGGGKADISVPDMLPSISKRSNGGKIKPKLLDEIDPDPKDNSLQCSIRVRKIAGMESRAGAYFEFAGDWLARRIANEVYCDFGAIVAPVKIKTKEIGGAAEETLIIEKDPTSTKDRVYLHITHTLVNELTPVKDCHNYPPGFCVDHFLSLYGLYFDCKANPAPHFEKCADPEEPPFGLSKRGNLVPDSIDPVICVGGGG